MKGCAGTRGSVMSQLGHIPNVGGGLESKARKGPDTGKTSSGADGVRGAPKCKWPPVEASAPGGAFCGATLI